MTTTDSSYPNSRRIYVKGNIHPYVRVSLREICQSPTRGPGDRTEENPNIAVYDTSGPWGDPEIRSEIAEGLAPLRRARVLHPRHAEQYPRRQTLPATTGYITP